MSHPSELAPSLLTAYRRTEYQVGAAVVLRISLYSEDLDLWQQRHGVESSAFVSAVNPRSAALDVHENQVRHERLRTRLAREGLSFEEGRGVDPEGRWPPEAGFLIAGVDQAHARRFGQEFDQNAVVWSGANAVPQLLLLR